MNNKVKKLMIELQNLDNVLPVLLVGGAVRDILLNKEPKDYDIATSIPMNVIEEHFETFDIGKNKEFGIVVVRYENENFEIAQFRTESNYSDNRHPDKVEIVNSFYEDSKRRDFSMNSLAIKLDGTIIDYHNGQEDIKNNIIRTVGDPNKRFNEDALRMLRAIRFAVQLDFSINCETFNAIIKNGFLLGNISRERILEELKKMASTYKFHEALEIMKTMNILKYVLPDIELMQDFPHNKEHHPEGLNVFSHTIATIKTANTNDWKLNFALLFHDIGKLVTFEDDNGRYRYNGHAKEGVKFFDDVTNKYLLLDNETSDMIKFCIENHMKVHKVLEMRKSKIAKLMNHKYWKYLKDVSFYDGACRNIEWLNEDLKKQNELFETISIGFIENNEYNKIRKFISGFKIMKWLDIKPSPKVGEVIDNTIDWIIENEIDYNNEDVVKKYIKETYL